MEQSEKAKQILPAIAVIIFNDKGEILLQKRKDINKWCIISGHVEFGETVEDAVLREIAEETNTKAIITRFIGIYSSPKSQTYFYDDRTVQYVTAYFEARFTEPFDTDFSNDETLELKYFRPDSIPLDLAPVNENWLSDALNTDSTIYLR